MKQIDYNTWTSSFGGVDLDYTYNTLEEAQAKLLELETDNPSGIAYMIESYPEGSEI